MFKSPMLAATLNEGLVKNHLKTKGPLFASPKLDGIRCNVSNGVAYGGRSGKPIKNQYIQSVLGTGEFEYLDGELIVGNPYGGDVYKRTASGVSTIKGSPLFTYWTFDHTEHPSDSYVERISQLGIYGVARPLPQRLLTNWEDVEAFEEDILSQEYEGIMLRRPNAQYVFGRATANSLDLMKVKREEDDEGRILECYEAMENKNVATTNAVGHTERSSHQENLVGKGMLGGFYLDFKGQVIKCAPGKFDHKERKDIWEQWLADPESLKKKFIKFRHFPYGADKKPRFPRALGFRIEEDMEPSVVSGS